MRERLGEGEAAKRRRERVRKQRPADLVARARLLSERGARALEAVVVVLADLVRSTDRVEDSLAVARER